MPSVATLRDAQTGIAALVERDLRQFWGALDLSKPEAARDALLRFTPVLVDTYGTGAASVAADWYDETRAEVGAASSFRATPSSSVKPEVVQSQVRFSASHLFTDNPDQMLAFLTGSSTKYAIAPGRETIATSAIRDPSARGWARITTGHGCDFCAMLAGRGHVYTEATVGFEAHGHCHCIAAPAWVSQASQTAPEAPVTEVPAPAAPTAPETPVREVVTVQGPAAPAAARPALRAPDARTLAALQPSRGGWTTKTRAKTLEAVRKTPEGKSLIKTIDSFQSGGSTAIPRLRSDIEKYLAGADDLAPGRVESIETLLGAIRESDAGSRGLFRGMRLPGTAQDALERYAPGSDVDLSLASFSSDSKLATAFTKGGAGQKVKNAHTPVLVEWVGAEKRALPIENVSKSRVFANEREWVGAGRFRVVSSRIAKRGGEDTVVVQMEQLEPW